MRQISIIAPKESYLRRKKPYFSMMDLFQLPSMTALKHATTMGKLIALYLFSTSFDFLSVVPGVSIARIVGLVTIVYSLIRIREFNIRIVSLTAYLYLLLALGLTSMFFMSNRSSILSYLSLVICIAVVFIALGYDYNESDIELCEAALVASAIVLCVLMFTSAGRAGKNALSGRTTVKIGDSRQDENEFCGYMIFAFSFYIQQLIRTRQPRSLLFIGLLFFVVLLTGSRGGLIGLGASGVSSLLTIFRKSKRQAIALMGMLIGVLVLILLFDSLINVLPPELSQRYRDISFETRTASIRIRAWQDVISAFLNSDMVNMLLGHGFGSTKYVTYFHDVCHNTYLEILYSVGVFGLIAFMGVALSSYRYSFSNGFYVEAASIVGFSVLMISLSDAQSKSMWAIFTICGMIVSTCKTRRRKNG